MDNDDDENIIQNMSPTQLDIYNNFTASEKDIFMSYMGIALDVIHVTPAIIDKCIDRTKAQVKRENILKEEAVKRENILKEEAAMVEHMKALAKTLKDFIALAKAKPGEVSFGTASSSQRVSTEMLASMTGMKLNPVSYRASPQAVTDLMAGRIALFTADLAVMLPQVQAGTIRALAVTSTKRVPQLPDVPTVDEAAGIKGYELIAWFGAFAPAGTPEPVIARLNDAVRKATASPEVQEKLGKTMGMTLAASSPAELAANVKTESAKWAKAVADAGIEKQ